MHSAHYRVTITRRESPFKTGQKAESIIANNLARMFHELLAATTDMAVLPGVLGCRPLQRTVQVRLGFDFGF
jgi:hypothetical protein